MSVGIGFPRWRVLKLLMIPDTSHTVAGGASLVFPFCEREQGPRVLVLRHHTSRLPKSCALRLRMNGKGEYEHMNPFLFYLREREILPRLKAVCRFSSSRCKRSIQVHVLPKRRTPRYVKSHFLSHSLPNQIAHL